MPKGKGSQNQTAKSKKERDQGQTTIQHYFKASAEKAKEKRTQSIAKTEPLPIEWTQEKTNIIPAIVKIEKEEKPTISEENVIQNTPESTQRLKLKEELPQSTSEVKIIRKYGEEGEINVPAFLIRDIMFFTLQPLLNRAIARQRPAKYPPTIRFLVHPYVHQFVFSTFKPITLDNDDKIRRVFGGDIRKEFDRGSYAIVNAPMTVSYTANTGKTVVTFHYAVYNQVGNKQWPIDYEDYVK